MRELVATIDLWRAQGQRIGRAVVIRTLGSAPRPEGATLLLSGDGRLAGSVRGGCVEAAAVHEIREAQAAGRSRVVRYGISDEQAWGVGLTCGGTIDVLIEPDLRQQLEAAARATDARAVVVSLDDDRPSAEQQVLVLHEGSQAPAGHQVRDTEILGLARVALEAETSRTVELDQRAFFIEIFPARPRLIVVGAVQVAMTLVRLARELGYETVVVDGRAAFATPERFPHADRLIVGWPDEVATQIGISPADAVVVMTHDPKFDEPAIVEALRAGCRYVGAMGSRRRHAERRRKLRADGWTEEDVVRLRGPVGLDLGGRSPAETALAIMAEVICVRRGGSGQPLRELPLRDSSLRELPPNDAPPDP
ncbi:XdhC family protein [soil metagenome]